MDEIIAQEVAELIALATHNYVAKHPSVEPKDEVCIFTAFLLISRRTSFAVIIQHSTSQPQSSLATILKEFGVIVCLGKRC